MANEPLQIREHTIIPVGHGVKTIHGVRARKMQAFLRDFRVLKVEQKLGLFAKQVCDRCHSFFPVSISVSNKLPPSEPRASLSRASDRNDGARILANPRR